MSSPERHAILGVLNTIQRPIFKESQKHYEHGVTNAPYKFMRRILSFYKSSMPTRYVQDIEYATLDDILIEVLASILDSRITGIPVIPFSIVPSGPVVLSGLHLHGYLDLMLNTKGLVSATVSNNHGDIPVNNGNIIITRDRHTNSATKSEISPADQFDLLCRYYNGERDFPVKLGIDLFWQVRYLTGTDEIKSSVYIAPYEKSDLANVHVMNADTSSIGYVYPQTHTNDIFLQIIRAPKRENQVLTIRKLIVEINRFYYWFHTIGALVYGENPYGERHAFPDPAVDLHNVIVNSIDIFSENSTMSAPMTVRRRSGGWLINDNSSFIDMLYNHPFGIYITEIELYHLTSANNMSRILGSGRRVVVRKQGVDTYLVSLL